jgi:hypothetical protein
MRAAVGASKSRRFLLATFLVASLTSSALAGPEKIKISPELFRCVLHNIAAAAGSVTKLRREDKRVIRDKDAQGFLAWLESALGHKIPMRDRPPRGKQFITSTFYKPVIKGVLRDKHGDPIEAIHSGVIRVREYLVVPVGTGTEDVSRAVRKNDEDLERSPIVDDPGDGEENFVKLEAKIKHPESVPLLLLPKPLRQAATRRGATQLLLDLDGVVDKPGIILPRRMVDQLFRSRESFEKHWDEIARYALTLTITRDGRTTPANDSEEVHGLIDRIGVLHETGLTDELRHDVAWVMYRRSSYQVSFPHPTRRVTEGPDRGKPESFAVQLTFDGDVRGAAVPATHGKKELRKEGLIGIKELSSINYKPDERVFEKKEPLDIARMPDEDLLVAADSDPALAELRLLVELRRRYDSLKSKVVGSGKRAEGQRRLERK